MPSPRWLVLLVPCLLLSFGAPLSSARAAPPKKRGPQMSIATYKQPARQTGRLPVKRTMHSAASPGHAVHR